MRFGRDITKLVISIIFRLEKTLKKADFNKDRAAILKLKEAGLSIKEVAKTMKMHPNNVRRTLKQIKARGGQTDCTFRGIKAATAVTSANIRRVKEMVRKNPVRVLKDIENACKVSKASASRLVKAAGLKSLGTIPKPFLSKSAILKRLERSLKLQKWLQANVSRQGHPKRAILWSDEKLFVVDQVLNRRNRRILVPAADINLQAAMKSKHPASVMVFGLVASDGNVMPPVFIDAGVKITGPVYRETILQPVMAWLKSTYGVAWKRKVVLMQDGAPAHTASATQTFLEKNFGEDGFWPKSFWPPSSPDLNPMDYWVWSALEAKVNARRHPNTQALKDSIVANWDTVLTPETVRNVSGKIDERLAKVIAAEGKYFN